MITGAKQHLTSVLLGVVAGLLVINAYGLFFKPDAKQAAINTQLSPQQRVELAAERVRLLKRSDPQAAKNPKVVELERKIAELQAREREARAKDQPDSRPQETQEEAKERVLTTWRDQLRAHDAEPVDPKFSTTYAPAFEADFTRLAQTRGFAVGAPDCRAKSCTVEVEWPSHGDAVDGFETLVNEQFANNCAVSVILPDPAAGAEGNPYKARYLFNDCQPQQTVAALDHSAR